MDIDAIQNTIKSISRRVDAAANSMFSSNFNSKDQMSRYFMHVISRFSFCQFEYRNLYLTGREHQRWKLDFYKLKHMMTQISVPGKKKGFCLKDYINSSQVKMRYSKWRTKPFLILCLPNEEQSDIRAREQIQQFDIFRLPTDETRWMFSSQSVRE